MKITKDILIVGGGIVGLTMAHLLADSSLSVAVLEAKPFKFTWPCNDYDSRVSALNQESRQLLSELKIWPAITALRFGPYESMKVWVNETEGLSFDAADFGQDYLGMIVENKILLKALSDTLPKEIEYLCPYTLESLSDSTVYTQEGLALEAKLIIAADGANSWIREHANIGIKTYSYKQKALVATVSSEFQHSLTAYQKFLPTGPLAFLPLDDPYLSSIVWSVDEQEADALLQLSKIDFQIRLTDALDQRLGQIELKSEIHAFSLQMRHAEQYVKPQLALIGDALRTLHPLAGQGLNLGLKDAKVLADVILTALNKKRDFTQLHTLKKYQRARKSASLAMIIAMEFFKQSFMHRDDRIAELRADVLAWLQTQNTVKESLVGFANGFL